VLTEDVEVVVVEVDAGAANDCTIKAIPSTATRAANTFVIRLIFILVLFLLLFSLNVLL